MTILFLVLIIIASVILGLIVLVQNPKGGGLAGNLGGISNQFMGVKQTTDVLEKGTWIFAGVIGLLCLLSTLFITVSKSTVPDLSKDVNINTNINTGNNPNTNTQPGTLTPPKDSGK